MIEIVEDFCSIINQTAMLSIQYTVMARELDMLETYANKTTCFICSRQKECDKIGKCKNCPKYDNAPKTIII